MVKIDPQHQDPRRRLPRHNTEVVQCPIGDVLDLSGSGMRVKTGNRCQFKTGQVLPMKLATPSGSVKVQAKIVWKKRKNLFGAAELGINFIGITPGQAVALATIARFGFVSPDNVRQIQGQPKARPQAASAADAKPKDEQPKVGESPSKVQATLVLQPYFETLGLDTDAQPQDIKSAYRKLARQYHPDLAPGEENARKFLELREAYDLIVRYHGKAG